MATISVDLVACILFLWLGCGTSPVLLMSSHSSVTFEYKQYFPEVTNCSHTGLVTSSQISLPSVTLKSHHSSLPVWWLPVCYDRYSNATLSLEGLEVSVSDEHPELFKSPGYLLLLC